MMRFRWDHLALTFPRGALTREFRKEVDAFYCDVLGWTAYDHDVFGENCYMLQPDDQSHIMLSETDEAQQLPVQDVGNIGDPHVQVPHMGILLDSNMDVDYLLAECQRFQQTDSRMRIREYPLYKWNRGLDHNFLMQYLLPVWFEVHWGEQLKVILPEHPRPGRGDVEGYEPLGRGAVKLP
jgi:hypothetical protein